MNQDVLAHYRGLAEARRRDLVQAHTLLVRLAEQVKLTPVEADFLDTLRRRYADAPGAA